MACLPTAERVLHILFLFAVTAALFTLSAQLAWAEEPSSSGHDSDNVLGGEFRQPNARFLAAAPASVPVGCDWPFGASSIHFQNCHAFDKGYKFLWNTLSDNMVLVGFSQKYNGYISWGVSPTGAMVKSSAIIGYPSATGGLTVDNFYLGGKDSEDVRPPGKLTVSSMRGEIVNGEIRILTNLTLTSTQMTRAKIIWAAGSYRQSDGNTLREHSAFGKATVDFRSGSFKQGATTLEASHGFLNALAWGLLIPLGITVARFGKSYEPAWFYGHICLQSLGVALGIAGFGTGIALKDLSQDVQTAHFGLAIVILILAVLQMGAFVWRPKKETKLRPMWEIYHHWVGRIAFVLAVANVYLGLNILGASKAAIAAFSVVLIAVVILFVVLEILRCFKLRAGKKKAQQDVEISSNTGMVAQG